jgi:Zn-dependent peptidase ImmA (M78 family)
MTNDQQQASSEPRPRDDVIARLRRMMPLRPLAFWEHKTIAEHQATRLLELLEQTSPAADLAWLTQLTKMQVVLLPKWKMDGLSGMTSWQNGKWLIGVNKGNPPARRRFTLVHEFKHALDANRDTVTYRGLAEPQRELIADYFAACFLMPKLWLRRAWTHGLQDPEALAGLFKVSRQAMDKRLHDLGYTDSEPERSVASYFRSANVRRDLAA